ncbi:pyridoxamine 5'-phosphate oxidase family protein [Parvibaculum sp.]|jgi:pyridoxamine 5'-phosphate oxidase|uniref:pyridoxamine 5'-phosphate oxidase family protein n=1 Tax=Parvibaculum sp. TaxID=2024848 RepID=UPI003BAD7F76
MPVMDFPSMPLEGEALRVLTLGDMAALALALPAAGLENAASPLRKPALSTLAADGAPAMRTVILRALEREARRFSFFTDARSHKVAEIAADPRASLLFYDPACDIQARFSGKAAIHRQGSLADAAWASAAPPSRRAYLAEAAPGALSSGPVSGLPQDVEGIIPPLERLEEGRGHFALLEFIFEEADILVLSRSGHRRARIRFSADAARGEWLYP